MLDAGVSWQLSTLSRFSNTTTQDSYHLVTGFSVIFHVEGHELVNYPIKLLLEIPIKRAMTRRWLISYKDLDSDKTHFPNSNHF